MFIRNAIGKRLAFPLYAVIVLSAGVAPDGALRAAQASPDLVAVYESSSSRESQNAVRAEQVWNLRREADRVEYRYPAKGYVEIWERTRGGEIALSGVFTELRRIVNYTSGDLRALGRYPEWAMVGSLIDPAALGRLEHSGGGTVLGRQAQRFIGRVGDEDIEILWLEDNALPALIRQVGPAGERRLRLLHLDSLAAGSEGRQETAGYERIDFADMGDNESDPFVKRLLHGEGGLEIHH